MSKTLIPAQRRERIHEYLSIHKIVPSSDLSKLLDVSEATVRRDLEWLEAQGILERTHGGAVLSQQLRFEPEYIQRAQVFVEEKRAIAKIASSFLKPGETILINSGTTTTQLILHIPRDINLTVITNNLQAALEVGEVGYKLILLGGDFQPKSNSVTGDYAIQNLEEVVADQSFISVDGISLKYGCTVFSQAESELIRTMIEHTNGPISLLIDHSKWGVVSNFEIAQINRFTRIIIDDVLEAEVYEELSQRSQELLLVGTGILRNAR